MRKLSAAACVSLALAAPLAAQAQNVAVVNGKPVPKARVEALLSQALRQGQPQRARHFLAHLCHGGCRVVTIRLDEPRVAQELRPRISHVQLMSFTNEELDAELVLQLPDLVTERRLRQPIAT